MDLFSARYPAFNHKGDSRLSTVEGFVVSVFVMTLLAMYATIKF